MTSRFLKFIGREKELECVENLVKLKNGIQILFVYGSGGIGKTKLLDQILTIYKNNASCVTFPIIDFDDTSNRFTDNIFNLIANSYRREFAKYFLCYADYLKILKSGVSRKRIEDEGVRVKDLFCQCYNELVSDRKGILLFDTIEILNRQDIWIEIANSLKELDNTLIILAGREYEQIKKIFGNIFISSAINLLDLPPFSQKDSFEYFHHYASKLDENINNKLFFLTNGHPILMALAIEWLKRDKPLPQIYEKTIDELRSLDDENKKHLINEFREVLVSQLLEPKELKDRVIIQMAFIHRRFNKSILALINKLSEDTSIKVIEELKEFPFVKSRAEGISLHDEMRALIEKHIWPKIDPMGIEQQKLAGTVVQFYKNEINKFESLQYDIIWLYEIEQLYYKLIIDANQGYEEFIRLFKEATNSYRYDVRNLILNEINNFKASYSFDKQYEIEIRKATMLFDEAAFMEAKNLLERMREIYDKDRQKIEILLLLGNVEIRQGSPNAIISLEEALEISRKSNLDFWIMRSLNALGWQNRLRNNFDQAMLNYQEALELAIKLGEKRDQAWILNNLAFKYSITVDYMEAIQACDQALFIWEELEDKRGIGACYEIYGTAYRRAEQFDKAHEYLNKALAIFEPANDQEWLSRIYLGIGTTYWVAKHNNESVSALKKALDYGIKKDEANILHQLSHAYSQQGKLKEAQKVLKRSYDLSIKTADAYYECNGLGDLIRIAVMMGHYKKLNKFVKMYNDFENRWSFSSFTNPKGRILKNLGDLALQANPLDVTMAINYYKQAIPLLSYRSYTFFSVANQLKSIDELIKRLKVPAQQVAKLGKNLYDFYKEKNLSNPMALRYILNWMNEGDLNDEK